MMSMSLPMCLHLLQAPIPSGRNVLDVDKKSLFCSQEIYQELYNTKETTPANRGKGRYLKRGRHYLINSICCNFINTIKLTFHTLCVVFILQKRWQLLGSTVKSSLGSTPRAALCRYVQTTERGRREEAEANVMAEQKPQSSFSKGQ